MSTKPKPRPREQVIADVSMAGRILSTAAVMFHTAVAEKQGLGLTEEKALDLLQRFGPMTAGELGQRAGLAPASVTGLVDRLEKKGFARREKDAVDGRRVLVHLVHEKLAAFAPLFADFMAQMDELYARYTVAELEVISGFMREAAARQQQATQTLRNPRPDRGRPE